MPSGGGVHSIKVGRRITAAKCSICAGAISGPTPSTFATRRLARAPRAAGEGARAHVTALPRARHPDAHLFPRYAEARVQSSLIACWRAVCADAKLGSLRLHDLRHTALS